MLRDRRLCQGERIRGWCCHRDNGLALVATKTASLGRGRCLTGCGRGLAEDDFRRRNNYLDTRGTRRHGWRRDARRGRASVAGWTFRHALVGAGSVAASGVAIGSSAANAGTAAERRATQTRVRTGFMGQSFFQEYGRLDDQESDFASFCTSYRQDCWNPFVDCVREKRNGQRTGVTPVPGRWRYFFTRRSRLPLFACRTCRYRAGVRAGRQGRAAGLGIG